MSPLVGKLNTAPIIPDTFIYVFGEQRTGNGHGTTCLVARQSSNFALVLRYYSLRCVYIMLSLSFLLAHLVRTIPITPIRRLACEQIVETSKKIVCLI